MRKRLGLTGLAAILAVIVLVSCASPPNLIGRWQQVDGDDVLVFREDGSFTAVDNTGATAIGRYTLHADGTIYYIVTHTDVMQAELRPVERFEIRIAGVRFRQVDRELAVTSVSESRDDEAGEGDMMLLFFIGNIVA